MEKKNTHSSNNAKIFRRKHFVYKSMHPLSHASDVVAPAKTANVSSTSHTLTQTGLKTMCAFLLLKSVIAINTSQKAVV